jgi:hypothetical protein
MGMSLIPTHLREAVLRDLIG